MSAVAVLSLLIGSLLGSRFRIFVLPPIIVLGAVMIGTVCALYGEGPAHAVVTILVFATVLQLGYLCGAILVRSRAAAYRTKAAPSFDSRGFS
ncbi:hypothetical protein ACWAT4_32735 [Bradyrhizobium manausense]